MSEDVDSIALRSLLVTRKLRSMDPDLFGVQDVEPLSLSFFGLIKLPLVHAIELLWRVDFPKKPFAHIVALSALRQVPALRCLEIRGRSRHGGRERERASVRTRLI